MSKLILVTNELCPNCKKAKDILSKFKVEYIEFPANNNVEFCKDNKIMMAPTLVFENYKYSGLSSIIKYCEELNGTDNTSK